MTVYIDHPKEHEGRWWCHVTADTQVELHRFAALMGLKIERFQDKDYKWHYDLLASKFQQAVDLGAKLITSKEMVRHMRTRGEYSGANKK